MQYVEVANFKKSTVHPGSEPCFWGLFSIKFQLEDVSNDRRHRDDAALPGGREDLYSGSAGRRWDRLVEGLENSSCPSEWPLKPHLLINQIEWNPISRVARSCHSIRLTPIVDGLNPILNKKA